MVGKEIKLENGNSFLEGRRDETTTKLTSDQPPSLAEFWKDSSFVSCFVMSSALLGIEKHTLIMSPRLSSSGISDRNHVQRRASCDLLAGSSSKHE